MELHFPVARAIDCAMKTLRSFINSATIPSLLFIAFLVCGCRMRSISNSGYQGGSYYGNPLYRGELNEFDILGVDRDQTVTEADISKALDTPAKVRLKKGNSVLLVQSGAMFPDEPMMTELGKFLNVVPFSGIPSREGKSRDAVQARSDEPSYAKSLRLMAARGGCETIVCYWGVLETAQKALASKPVSWVPVVGWSLPDESQQMRIRLKAAIIDVRTGNWSMFCPEPAGDTTTSGRLTRETADQRQVDTLKRTAYEACAKDLIKIYGN